MTTRASGTKWKAVAAVIGLFLFAALVLVCISLAKPLNARIGKMSFGVGTREGFTLAPGRITDGEIIRFPNLSIYSWYVKAGKRKLWVCSVAVDKTNKK
jgi:hypothetical protein